MKRARKAREWWVVVGKFGSLCIHKSAGDADYCGASRRSVVRVREVLPKPRRKRAKRGRPMRNGEGGAR